MISSCTAKSLKICPEPSTHRVLDLNLSDGCVRCLGQEEHTRHVWPRLQGQAHMSSHMSSQRCTKKTCTVTCTAGLVTIKCMVACTAYGPPALTLQLDSPKPVGGPTTPPPRSDLLVGPSPSLPPPPPPRRLTLVYWHTSFSSTNAWLIWHCTLYCSIDVSSGTACGTRLGPTPLLVLTRHTMGQVQTSLSPSFGLKWMRCARSAAYAPTSCAAPSAGMTT
jgi:hypothetical protein